MSHRKTMPIKTDLNLNKNANLIPINDAESENNINNQEFELKVN